jgi:hypothetical protein
MSPDGSLPGHFPSAASSPPSARPPLVQGLERSPLRAITATNMSEACLMIPTRKGP